MPGMPIHSSSLRGSMMLILRSPVAVVPMTVASNSDPAYFNPCSMIAVLPLDRSRGTAVSRNSTERIIMMTQGYFGICPWSGVARILLD